MNIDKTRLAGKVAIVTGAASGIGAASARRLAAEGAHVLLTDIQDEVGFDLAAELDSLDGGQASFLHCNVADEAHVADAVRTAVERWGRLDIMHNNAGFGGVSGPIESTTADGWASTMDVLLTSVFYGTKYATPAMRDGGGGSIINTASVCGLQAGIGSHVYTVAKHGVVGLTRSTALELAEYNIRVNAVCPGYIATSLNANRSRSEIDDAEMTERLDKARGRLANSQPMNRMGEPDDIAAAVAWLASDDSEWVTGTEQVVDGGLLNGRPWRKLHKAITEDRPVRLYAPGSYD
ncbi:MAG: SDR family NAD(P)-dependent oxidoreductase [Acidimicrobiales bacterium]|jgi:NAD(P)-dependent dehydrogenase (short-subunit alcohol dehydrogenase family)|tara:strand:+ start:130 stop:1008 length:879 start_codon:yes stop_codon:yes gene_type:complete